MIPGGRARNNGDWGSSPGTGIAYSLVHWEGLQPALEACGPEPASPIFALRAGGAV